MTAYQRVTYSAFINFVPQAFVQLLMPGDIIRYAAEMSSFSVKKKYRLIIYKIRNIARSLTGVFTSSLWSTVAQLVLECGTRDRQKVVRSKLSQD